MAAPAIGVLVSLPDTGGHADHVDLRSGADLVSALTRLGYRAVLLRADDDLDLTLRQSRVDACLLALHGRLGGSGEVQSLLTMRGIPYFGAGAGTVALAFDKVRARQMLAYHNLPVPAAIALGADQHVERRALDLLGWPCVLKPRRGAQGDGVTRLEQHDAVEEAVDRALSYDTELVLERACDGPEIRAVVWNDRVLGLLQADPDGSMVCPPELGRGRRDGLEHLARRAAASLGLDRTLCRVDMLLTSRHNEIILEVEPLPPLHRDGVVARVARAAGMEYPQLVVALLEDLRTETRNIRGREHQSAVLQ